jgi:hypothetical protein
MGAGTHKIANMITLQHDCVSFLVFLAFSYDFFFNEIFCNLLLKIHIIAPIDHMFYVNHFE